MHIVLAVLIVLAIVALVAMIMALPIMLIVNYLFSPCGMLFKTTCTTNKSD